MTSSCDQPTSADLIASAIVDYLHTLPGFDPDDDVDHDFALELLSDFPQIDILDQVKAFRWYHDGRPDRANPRLRLAIRRWLTRARPPEPF